MKILVTGATGFVGQQFIASMRDNYEIHALVRDHNVSISGAKVHHYDGTIRSIKTALNETDAVLHLATCYRAEHTENDIAPLLEANLVFGAHLLEAMKQTETSRIVNIGTTWQKFGNEHYRYANLYAATKQAFQELLDFYADAYQWNCLNLHFNDTYGKDDHRKKIIQLLIETARTGASLDMSPGEQRFETCHISDAVNALNISLKRIYTLGESRKEEFSILTGDDVSLKELVATVERVIQLPIHVNWGKRPYRAREVMITPKQVYKQLPGWRKQIGLIEGIKDLIVSKTT